MDPSNKATPGFESPGPVAEPSPLAAGEVLPDVAERTTAAAEGMPTPAALGSAAPPTLPLPEPPASMSVAPTNDVTVTTPPPTTSLDDDDDQIEKVWVDKAKQIVEHTREDPHKQSEELTVFKADYMKKRYGKTIKIS
ncbi:MAG TPA: hypothetical protein VNG32_00995 [Candidatus Dormibacteraeota bacterium]|nr:hypothetical protein [Candidatus Dormibacteraeota bacterium]